jgi:hypothetical protein
LIISVAMITHKLTPWLYNGLTLDVGLLAPFFLVVILALAMDNSWLSGLLSRPAMVLLGDASYALYILHVPVRWLVERALALAGLNIPFSTMYAVYMPLMVLLSMAVFILIERPARDWLREHIGRMPMMLLDLVLIAAAVWASFALRLGARAEDFANAETLALRSAPILYFVALVAFRFYKGGGAAWKSLIPAVVLGALAMMGLMYLASESGWVELFSRSLLLLDAALTFLFILAARWLLRLWKPRARLAGEQA